jgi:hypothetical protein
MRPPKMGNRSAYKKDKEEQDGQARAIDIAERQP